MDREPGQLDERVEHFARRELDCALRKISDGGQRAPNVKLSRIAARERAAWDSEAFRLHSHTTGVHVLACSGRGLLNGVYELLRHIGVRFPFPGADRFPAHPDWGALRSACGQESSWISPSFRHRILHFDNLRLTHEMIDWIGKLRINMIQQPLHVFHKDIAKSSEMLDMLMDRGIEINVGAHGFDNWLPPHVYGKQHPDWYATSHAARRGDFRQPDDTQTPAQFATGQLCLSNRGMIVEFAENVVRFLRDYPAVGTVSLWPNDIIGGWCACEACLALEPAPNRVDPQTGTPSRSASYLNFIQQVGELVHAKVPNARIEFAGFYDCATPPSDLRRIPQGDHYLGFLIDDYFGCLLHGHCEPWNRQRFGDSHHVWRTAFSGEMFAVGYYADLCKFMEAPVVLATKIHDDFSYLKDEIGCDSVMSLVVCAGLQYLMQFMFPNIYCFAVLAWNHRRAVQNVLSELATGISPDGAGPLYRYFQRWDELGQNHPEKHGGWLWIDTEPQQASWPEVARQLRLSDILSIQQAYNLQKYLTEARRLSGSDLAALQVIKKMQKALQICRELLDCRASDPPGERLSRLGKIRRTIASRGPFPAGIVPMLDRLEGQARDEMLSSRNDRRHLPC